MLQMDELLECTLLQLHVRKLHMHKKKMGNVGRTYSMKSEKQPDNIQLLSVYSVY